MRNYKSKFFLLVLFSLALSQIEVTAQVADRWQQRVEYDMEIDFDVEKHQFTGVQKIKYYNNSPDTLNKVFYHLYFNAFQPNSMMDVRSRSIRDPDGRVGDRIYYLSREEQGYHNIQSLAADGRACDFTMEGTILEVELPRPLAPGKHVELLMKFDSQVPIQIRRSGRDNKEGIKYSMAQWYPKLCEYDYQGWHANPYIGREFHGVWGDFDVKISINGKYIVPASGVQQSKNEYVSKTDQKRTWHYRAENVHDFVWAADPDYRFIKHQAKDGVELQFFFQPGDETTENWEKLPEIMDDALSFMNKKYGKYPYPVYKFIQGGDGGMEYPMATLITGERSLGSLVGVSIHEWMHSWYQMVLATNEALYPWMDEGFTSYGSTQTMHHIRTLGHFGDYDANKNPFEGVYDGYVGYAMSGIAEPLSTHADHYNTNRAYGISSYTKGQVFLRQLEYVIGTRDFDRTMLRYFNEWKFKHPNVNDFIRIAEKTSGLELDWYKEYWVNTIHNIDYSVLVVKQDEDLNNMFIVMAREEKMPMPVDVEITYSDGSKHQVNVALGMMRGNKGFDFGGGSKVTLAKDWKWTDKAYTLEVYTLGKEVEKVEIDPSGRMADVNKSNNIWIKLDEEEID